MTYHFLPSEMCSIVGLLKLNNNPIIKVYINLEGLFQVFSDVCKVHNHKEQDGDPAASLFVAMLL